MLFHFKMSLKTLAISSLTVLTLGLTSLASAETARAEGGYRWQFLEQLDLSEAQSDELETIRAATHSRIQAVLTDDQQAKLEAAREAGQTRQQAWQSIELNDAQRSQIRAISEDAREEMQSVLTAEQRQQLQEMRQARQQSRLNRPAGRDSR